MFAKRSMAITEDEVTTVHDIMAEVRLKGLISIGDVVKLIIENMNLLITKLEKYILGIDKGDKSSLTDSLGHSAGKLITR